MKFDEGNLLEGKRLCVECNVVKHITDFHWTKDKRGRRRKCKKCCIEKHREYRNNNREAYRRSALKWHLNSKYNISIEVYDKMLVSQKNKCKICDVAFDLEDQNRRPHVDHCHETGKVRGILCFICNTALGKFKDDVELLHKAISYLEAEQ